MNNDTTTTALSTATSSDNRDSISSFGTSIADETTGVVDVAAHIELHPWAKGKKVLKPVQEGEKISADLSNPLSRDSKSTAELIDADIELREHLLKALEEKEELSQLLLETARSELGNQEDELFVLRETHEEHGRELKELRKAKDFAETERSLTLQAKDQIEHETSELATALRAEAASLATELAGSRAELGEAKAIQAEQEEACMELLEEQKKLEIAYNEAVAQLDTRHTRSSIPEGDDNGGEDEVRLLCHTFADCDDNLIQLQVTSLHSVTLLEIPDRPVYDGDLLPSQTMQAIHGEYSQDGLEDVSQEWERIDAEDMVSPPYRIQAANRRTTGRFLSKRRRTPPTHLLLSAASPGEDVRTVKNDVEQLKQTIAMLLRDRGASFEQSRESME
ncbi:hypothetical protein JCM11641_005530 [Rhodosporidiobolus odoratus]